jgi:alginate O-acetyltransferase complex protein AlgI
MVFSSVTFLYFFLPIFLAAYLVLPFRNSVLLAASLFFYAWGELAYVFLLLGSIALNWAVGLGIARFEERGARGARAMLGVGIAGNLLLLGVFKYANFAIENLGPLLGVRGELAAMHFPIGISFFTFQAMSYLIDVYRRDAGAERNPFLLATYISMFPQLVAGPIVRFRSIQGELHARTIDARKFERGIRFLAIGLGQKVVIANALAVPVDAIFGVAAADLTTPLAWLAATAYTLQIYYDFAGYSNMAIGLGLMLGFHLPVNFEYPYIAQSISEFWRRWHITLSTWFRDYLYIPLGGNRAGALRTTRNLLVVFLLCGLWHGAAWTFVVWGLYHGAFLVIERVGFGNALVRIPRALRHGYTLGVVVAGFVIFRADSLVQAGGFLAAMAGFARGDGLVDHLGLHLRADVVLIFAVAVAGSAPLLPWLADRLGGWARTSGGRPGRVLVRGAVVAGVAALFLLSGMRLAAGTHNPFIYFRF